MNIRILKRGSFLFIVVMISLSIVTQSTSTILNQKQINNSTIYNNCKFVEVALRGNDKPNEWFDNHDNHFDNIWDAIDYVCEEGVVLIHKGEYDIGPVSIDIYKSLTLKGENKENTKIRTTGSATQIIAIKKPNVTISNITIEGCKYIHDDSSIQAGIRITFNTNDKPGVIIENNTIIHNENGIYCNSITSNHSFITIKDNIIKDNYRDGIIIANSYTKVYNNTIINNSQGGIDVWGMQFNFIYNNDIIKNLDGIWMDVTCNNTIKNNVIRNNNRNGITLVDDENPDYIRCCIGNSIFNNSISFNNNSGIYLYHAKGNNIFHNNIEYNRNEGIRIQHYFNSKEFFIKQHRSVDNNIYENNFIINLTNNKTSAMETIRDSNNKWFYEDSNTKSGNFWNDINVTEQMEYNRDGTWVNGSYQISFSFLDFDFSKASENYDIHPYCRMNGWVLDKRPTIPNLNLSDNTARDISIKSGTKIGFIVNSTDINRDLVEYGFNWTANKSVPISSLKVDKDCWENNDNNYYPPGEPEKIFHTFNEKGTYQVYVVARDYCPNPYDECKTDGISNWSRPINITVI